jgi:hypothetical protein
MSSELEVGLYIFMLAGFLGYHIITRVPPLLHTPLMSATNAIAAISLVGSLVVWAPTTAPFERLGLHPARVRLSRARRRTPSAGSIGPHAADVQDAEGVRAARALVDCGVRLRLGVAAAVGGLYREAGGLTMGTFLAARRSGGAALLLHRLRRCSYWG